MLLAIDTATRYMSLALHDGRTLIAEQSWRTGKRQNTLLAPAIRQIMEVCGVDMRDLTALAVAIGPGSYTGLRIGISLAKGMATAAGLPLIGISTLDILAVAQPFQSTRYSLITVVQAGRGRIIAGQYRVKKGRWLAEGEPTITTWDEYLDELEGTYYLTGEIDADGHAAIDALHDPEKLSITIMSGAHRIRRAGFLAEEALRRLDEQKSSSFVAEQIVPLYLKTPG